jgi:hypothetical protein
MVDLIDRPDLNLALAGAFGDRSGNGYLKGLGDTSGECEKG